jgi:hypothetical protein
MADMCNGSGYRRRLPVIAALIAAIGVGASAPDAARAEQRTVAIADAAGQYTNDQAHVLRRALLTAIESWLVAQLGLPPAQDQPGIELVPPARITALRYRGLVAEPAIGTAHLDPAPPDGDVVAVYSDMTRTIYLAEGWTGRTAAELSVLVHEMVHHLQNAGGLRYECAQAREALAYQAQDRWLALFGHSLEQDFELDGFSLLVKTRCMN